MSRERESVLDAIRRALADRPGSVSVPRDYRGTVPVKESDVAARFAARVRAYAAVVHDATEADVRTTVETICRSRRVSEIVAAPSVPREWLPAGPTVTVDKDLSPRELDGMDAVLSGCVAAIASTGTIVLDHGPSQGRRVITLLPDLHICVVAVDQIVATVPEAIARLDSDRPLTFISGPSATSDIEMQRVEGVHGPRRLEIVLVCKSCERVAGGSRVGASHDGGNRIP